MGNCLKTQLKEVVQNDNLMKLGVIELSVTENASYGENVNKVQFAGDGTVIKIVGDGVLATSYANVPTSTHKEYTIVGNNGVNLFFSNGNYKIEISKYTVTNISIDPDGTYASTIILKNQKELVGASSLVQLIVNSTQDIDFANIGKEQIYYRIKFVAAHGDVTGIKPRIFGVSRQPIYGDFTDIIKYAGSSTPRGGRSLISPVGTTNLCTCDLSEASEYIYFLTYYSNQQKINYSWTKTRDSSYPIISIEGGEKANFGGYLDTMLINQANCTATTHTEIKKIDVYGAKTSASDSAVETLKSKGYTVIVNGVTL